MALFHTTVVDNQIKALSTIGSASGAICTFDTDMAERLVNLEVAITATGGGGTPVSPIAINGFSQANILVASKNLFNKATIVNNKWFSDNGSIISLNGRFYSALIPVEPNTDYYLTNVVGAGSFISTVHFESDKTTIIGAKNILGSNTQSGYITTFSNSAFMLVNGFLSDIDTVQVVKGNTATAYEQPTTETIPFGQTVYGGRLNVGSGVLTVTHGYIDLSTLTWIYNSTYQVFYSPDDFGEYRGVGKLGLCEIYTVVDNVDSDANVPATDNIICGFIPTNNHRLYVRNTAYTDETAFTNSMTGKYLAYKLATPTTIQLDSKQIQAIIGTNNIYADTGDIIDLKYILSVGKAIN